EQLVSVFTKAFLGSWFEALTQMEPALGTFRRPEHERILAEFQDLDRRQLQTNAQRVAQRALGQRPAAESSASEIAVLQQAKAKTIPLARLLAEIPQIVLQLKPCLLMRPEEVGNLLAASLYRFDL